VARISVRRDWRRRAGWTLYLVSLVALWWLRLGVRGGVAEDGLGMAAWSWYEPEDGCALGVKK